jgi:hypothetical protein
MQHRARAAARSDVRYTRHRTGPAVSLVAAVAAVVGLAAACSSADASRGVHVAPDRVARSTTTTTVAVTSTSHPSTTVATRPPARRAPGAPSATVAPTTSTSRPRPLVAPATVHGVFALGDSVMLGAAPQLRARGISVDAVESRQWETGVAILARMAAARALPPTVVVHLGTNGAISGAQFDEMMRVLAGHRVIFLTVKEPRSWEGEVNLTLLAGSTRWRGVTLLDWHGVSTPHDDWFWSDRIHLRPQGAQAYAALVAATAA